MTSSTRPLTTGDGLQKSRDPLKTKTPVDSPASPGPGGSTWAAFQGSPPPQITRARNLFLEGVGGGTSKRDSRLVAQAGVLARAGDWH